MSDINPVIDDKPRPLYIEREKAVHVADMNLVNL